MAWTVERSAEADLDLALIFDFLLAAALDFGQPTDRAFEQAARRARDIEQAIFALGNAPHQRTPDLALLPGLRTVSGRGLFAAVFHFLLLPFILQHSRIRALW